MAPNDRTTRLQLRFETSQADINRAKTAVGSLLQGIDALEAQQRALDAQYARSIQTQIENARALNQSSNFVASLRSDLATLANEQENVNRAQDRANRSTNEGIDLLGRYRRAVDNATIAEMKRVGSVSAGAAGQLGQVDRFGRVGGQILGGLGLGEAANAVNLVGDVADSFTLLNPAMLAVTGATVVMGLAFGDLQRRADEARKKVEDITRAILDFNRQAAEGVTSDEVREQVDIANRERERLQARRDEIADILSNFGPLGLSPEVSEQQLADLNRRISDVTFGQITDLVSGSIAAGDAGFLQAQGVLTGLNGRFNELTTTIVQGKGAIEDRLFLENDLSATNERINEGLSVFGGVAGNLVTVFQDATREAYEAAEALALANSEKTKEIQLAREAAAQAAAATRAQGITDTTSQLFDAQEKVVQGHINEAAALKALTDTQNESLANIGTLERQAEQERSTNIQEAADQRAKIIEDSEERILDITRKAGRSVFNAIGARDSLAAHLAAQNAKDQIDDEQRAAQKRLRELDTSLEKQNRLVDTKLRERIALEQARGQQELAARRQALAQAQVDLRNALFAEQAIRQQYQSFFVVEAGKAGFEAAKNLLFSFRQGMLAEDKSRVNPNFYNNRQGYFYTAPQFTGTIAPSPTLFTQPQTNQVSFQFLGETVGTMAKIGRNEAVQRVGKLLDSLGYK